MSKYCFKPESVDLLPSLPLIVAIIAISVFLSAALDTSHGIVDRVACSCLQAHTFSLRPPDFRAKSCSTELP